MADKRRVIILFGGRSAEHEVSILSARNVCAALDRDRFEPVLVGIDKQGRWLSADETALLAASGDPRQLTLHASGPELPVPVRPVAAAEVGPLLRHDDVVFPVLHGTYGEDGTVQGLLELADVAYVGPGHLGSAIGMDKEVSKRLLAQAGVPVVPWRTVHAVDHRRDPERTARLGAELGYPLFVKPANAGSSVGVSKVRGPEQLAAAVELALSFDTKCLLEQAVDAREIECAVLGNDDPQASRPGEIIVHHADGFYSYAAKYVDADASYWQIPAEITPEQEATVRRLAVETFRALELAGMARVDFFLDRATGELLVNEVNTIPGFTAISMYPKMWEAAGVPVRDLVTRLVELAIARRAARRALKTSL
ncbi:MAG TPA: D-alanine--D-alanine ligase family protein [Myxococcota bacterium]|nr:D-alanine--D-alanine ligase family protein [Myxococcota bacterium]